MTEYLKMPRLSRSAAEGTLTVCHRREGDYVFVREALFQVQAAGISGEVLAPWDGILRKVYYEEGMSVPVGEIMAEIEREPLLSRR